MIENCTVYLPNTDVNFKAVFPGGTSDAAPNSRPTRYEYQTPEGPIQLNLKYTDQDSNHLQGLTEYIRQLDNEPAEINRAVDMIDQVEMFFGVVLPTPISAESETFQSLTFLAESQNGFLFVEGSILNAQGYIVGPMTYQADNLTDEHDVILDPQDGTASGPDVANSASSALSNQRRQASIVELERHGFIHIEPLPARRSGVTGCLRPSTEIASRLFAQMALFMWVIAPEEKATSDGIAKFVANNGLFESYTASEWAILQLDRGQANADHAAQIGWQLENIWALAWVCGFDPQPTLLSGQISGEITRSVLEYLPNLGGKVTEFVDQHPLRSTADVSTQEDLFYCAHNVVSNTQPGSTTVPSSFDLTLHGGAIAERLRALTWCLSPGTAWADTDLAT